MAASFVARPQYRANVAIQQYNPFTMASKTVFLFFLSLLLRASLSLPISLDVKTVQSDSETAITERTVFGSETILKLEEEIKHVESLTTENVIYAFESVQENRGKRMKRDVIKPGQALCPSDRFEYGGRCLTKEQYEEYNDVSEGSDDYEAER